MFWVGKILGLLTLGGGVVNTLLIRRFLSGIAVVLSLVIASTLMVGALLVAGLYGLYHLLVIYGLAYNAAIFATAAIAGIVTFALIYATIFRAKKLFDMPEHFIQSSSPFSGYASQIADAFVDGLLTRQVRETESL